MYLIIAFFIVIGLAAGVLIFLARSNTKRRLREALSMRVLTIRLPQKSTSKESGGDFKDEINLSSQLFSILAGLNQSFCLEAAVHHVGEEIHFYVSVPNSSVQAVSRQIEGLWKDAQVERSDEYTIFNPKGTVAGGYVAQKISFALPLRTYAESNVDTFAPILNGLSKVNELAEGGAIQIVAKPAEEKYRKSAFQMLADLKKGAKPEEVLKGMKIDLKDFQKAFSTQEEKEKEEKIIDEETIKALQSKISKPLLAVNVRIMASAPEMFEAESLLEGMAQGFSQFSSPRHQELKIVKPRQIKKFAYQYAFREFDESQAMILNIEELASIFHLPASSTEVPKIKWLKAKEAQIPSNLPNSGSLIGEAVFRGEFKPVYMTDEDRRRHLYIIGQTGTGKSNFMKHLMVEDIFAGKGVGVIDPHGEFVEKILSVIPKERLDDVILFDPSDINRPVGMNLLEYDMSKPEEKTFIINTLLDILDKLYDMKTAGGPMFEQYLKNATLLLMEDMRNEPATLVELPRVFTDDEYRLRKIARIANPVVVDFWEKEAAKASGEHSLANMSSYITSKFNSFISNDYLRPIIGQPESAINFRQVMDEKKILLINLSKGKIGDLNMSLLGMVIIGKILMAALSRADMPEDERNDFYLYIDEFQNFATDAIETIFSEARKYHLSLIVAHQFIAQLKEKIRDAIFGNVGTKIVFRIGTPDAEFLAKEFEPVFNPNDLVSIDNFNAYVRLLIKGETARPFRMKALLSRSGDSEYAEKIREVCRLKYGRDRFEVEEEILRRLRS